MTTVTSTIVIDPLLRLGEVLAVFPISKSSWYQGVLDGIYPKPVKIGPRASAWRASDIKKLIESCGEGSLNHAV